MRGLHWRLLLLLNLLAAFVSAAFWCFAYVAPDAVGAMTTETPGVVTIAMRDNPVVRFVVVVAAVLLAGDVLWLIYGRQPRVPSNHVLSESPAGPVRVSRDALENSLRLAGETLPEISRLRVTVDPSGGPRRIAVRAQFQAPDGVSIQSTSQELRKAIAARFRELVQLGDGARLEIDIEFLGFAGKLTKRAGEPPRAAEPEAFTGPRYPIEDDEDDGYVRKGGR